MDKAVRRLAFAQRQVIDESDAEFVFEDAHDVVREGTHALMAAEGLKPLSHEPVVAFMQDVLFLPPETVERFDGYRKLNETGFREHEMPNISLLRDKSLYAARRISAGKAQEARGFALTLMPELRRRVQNRMT